MEINEHTYEEVLSCLHDGLYFTDTNREINYWNKAAESISGFTAEEVVGKACRNSILTHIDAEGARLCSGTCPLQVAMDSGTPYEAPMYMHHKKGHRIQVSVRTAPLRNPQGELIGCTQLFSDISGQEANVLRMKELERMAMLDSLTQLANRNYITRELAGRMEELKRYGAPFGILLADIDHFKAVNDTYGHDVGDKILQAVAGTFTSNARAFDLYGRWGGEEFIGIIRNIEAENLAALGDRMRLLVEKSYVIHNHQPLHVTLSIGAVTAKPDETQDELVKRADLLMYQSKAHGRNQLTLG